jgi:inner membrane protein YidH
MGKPGVLRTSLRRLGAAPDPRFTLANERTFLAWNRTALALVAGGLAAVQLLKFGVGGAGVMIGLPLIVLGAVLAVAGFLRWRASEIAMRTGTRLPHSRTAPALLGIGATGVALLAVVLLTVSQLR